MKFHLSFNDATRITKVYLIIFLVSGLSVPCNAALNVKWMQAFGESKVLKQYGLDEIQKLKQTKSRELDILSGKVVLWSGVTLSVLIEDALNTVAVEGRSQIDLFVIKNERGKRALLPRALVVKYPMLLAHQREGKDLGGRGPYQLVVPWTSNSKIKTEDAFLESFYMDQITEIELTNYRTLFPGIYLIKRSDPAAIRGEKLFVQNCISCHGVGEGPDFGLLFKVPGDIQRKTLAALPHPKKNDGKAWKEREWRSFTSYWSEVKAQNLGKIVDPKAR